MESEDKKKKNVRAKIKEKTVKKEEEEKPVQPSKPMAKGSYPKDKVKKEKVKKEEKDKKEVKKEVKVKKPKPKKKKVTVTEGGSENKIVTAAVYKKKSIPEHIRTLVWNLWIGEDVPRSKCMCCKATEIHLRHFQAGHVVAEANGGSTEICNLRPICQPCNLAMGTRNMEEFIATFGLAAAKAKE